MSDALGAARCRYHSLFESFSGPDGIPRVCEAVQLLLCGHSAIAVARGFVILPETLRVQRKHNYAKLGVSSQGDLFWPLLKSLPKFDEGHLP